MQKSEFGYMVADEASEVTEEIFSNLSKGGPYTTEAILGRGGKIIDNIMKEFGSEKPERLNRAQRRYFDKHDTACKKCGILWSRKWEEWSNCTVTALPALRGGGHKFL